MWFLSTDSALPFVVVDDGDIPMKLLIKSVRPQMSRIMHRLGQKRRRSATSGLHSLVMVNSDCSIVLG